jgi:HAD superfamily hydrolase (TIGR01509 family)
MTTAQQDPLTTDHTSDHTSHHASYQSRRLPTAIVFDFDGLICDTEGAQVEAVSALFERHNATFPLDRWLQTIGTSTAEDNWVPWLAEQVNGTFDQQKAFAEFQAHNRELVSALKPNPGIESILGMAASAKVPVAIASSSPSSWIEPLLHSLGLREAFDIVVSREHVVRAKPAPDLYLLAMKRLGLPSADLAVALEDSRNGSLAAVAAGMHCVAVPGPVTARQDFSHVQRRVSSLAVINSLHELLEI